MLFLNDVSFFICLPNYEKNTKSRQDISPPNQTRTINGVTYHFDENGRVKQL